MFLVSQAHARTKPTAETDRSVPTACMYVQLIHYLEGSMLTQNCNTQYEKFWVTTSTWVLPPMRCSLVSDRKATVNRIQLVVDGLLPRKAKSVGRYYGYLHNNQPALTRVSSIRGYLDPLSVERSGETLNDYCIVLLPTLGCG